MKKVLIWDIFPRTNTGGPSGYLYNLREYLLTHPSKQIYFFTDLVLEKYGDAEWLHQIVPPVYHPKTYLGQIWKQWRHGYYWFVRPFVEIEFSIPKDICIDGYDYVHIHQVNHLQQFRRLYPKFKGKIILTSHCPCPLTEEILNYTTTKGSRLHKLLSLIKPYILHKECTAYDIADFIMFPCFGARESYEKNPKMKEAFMRNNKKFFYVPTAIVDYNLSFDTVQKLSDFNIPNDAFVITYFGRHISIKGYDILKKVGLSLLEKNHQLYFLCAGNGPIEPPQHPRWIELGFINNVDELLPQSSLYILPNRETYFDLITLQILRASVPVILSETGGNKYFKELPISETKGMMFFNIYDEQQLKKMVLECMNLKRGEPKRYQAMRESNRMLYENYFTLDKYVERYVSFLDKL